MSFGGGSGGGAAAEAGLVRLAAAQRFARPRDRPYVALGAGFCHWRLPPGGMRRRGGVDRLVD